MRAVWAAAQGAELGPLELLKSSTSCLPPITSCFLFSQTLQMGIKHFSGLFVMLCVGVALSLLTTAAEHLVHRAVLPRVNEPRFKYWLHTSQVTAASAEQRRAPRTCWMLTRLFFQRLHRALNSDFTADKLTTAADPEQRYACAALSRHRGQEAPHPD